MNNWYPVMLDINERRCVVIGGGRVAARHIASLLNCAAKVTVVSPQVVSDIDEWVSEGRVDLLKRVYCGDSDLQNAHFVIAATHDRETNAKVAHDARKYNIPVNDATNSAGSTFMVPAVVRRGRLVIAVSTSGASPGLASRISSELGEVYGPDYEPYVDFLADFREKVMNRIGHKKTRAIIFQNVLKSDILDMVRSGTLNDFRKRVFAELEQEHAADYWEPFFASLNGLR